jgi:hypothetical protein
MKRRCRLTSHIAAAVTARFFSPAPPHPPREGGYPGRRGRSHTPREAWQRGHVAAGQGRGVMRERQEVVGMTAEELREALDAIREQLEQEPAIVDELEVAIRSRDEQTVRGILHHLRNFFGVLAALVDAVRVEGASR